MTTDMERYEGDATPAPYDAPTVPAISREFIRPRLPEVGRIRCGEKETKTVTRGGKQVEVTFPKKLGTFRFTSSERSLIERVAELYGGEVKPWASDEGPQWQVVSEANSINVIVPTADLAFSQYFELWDGGGCQRRCDGHYEMLGDRQCVCDPAERAAGKEGSCKPTTRLGVFLPGVRGLGVWRLETHGKNAGSEIKGAVMMVAAYGAGLTRATLTTAIRPGRQRKPDGTFTPVRYVVPTLIPDDDIDQWVDRAQLEASGVQGVLSSSHDYPAPTDDKMRELFAAFNKAWPKGDDESPDEYRERRLSWSENVLDRDIDSINTWNGPQAPETLTRADVQTLLDALQAAPDPGPSAPVSSGTSASGADLRCTPACSEGHTYQAGCVLQSSTGAADGTLPASRSPGTPALAPVDQGSAGDDPEGAKANRKAEPPAEHRTAEALGEVAPADGTVPAGESRSDTGLPPGAAPTPAAVERPRGQAVPAAPTRRRTDPTGAPKIAQAIEENQRFHAERAQQPVIEHEPTDPLHFIPSPTFRQLYVAWFENQAGGDWGKGMEDCRRHAQAHLDRLRSEGKMGDEFTHAQLEAMAAETFERKP